MCGIAGIHVFNPDKAPKWQQMEHAVDQLLVDIDHRGGDATGFVAIGQDGDIEHQKASCKAEEFYKARRSIPFDTRSVLLHTRMATQGSAAFPENNHPVKRGSVYVVHNGHIWNDWDIFRKAKRDRYGEVDSEAIAALIAKYGIMNTDKAMEEISGAAAIGVVDDSRPGLMVLAKGSSSPLMFYRNENIAVFASEKHAVRRAWQILYGTPPQEKKIVEFKEGTAYFMDTDVEKREFVPDDYYYYRSVSGATTTYKSYGGYKGTKSSKLYKGESDSAWSEACENGKCWRTPTFTSVNGIRLCENCKEDYLDDPYGFETQLNDEGRSYRFADYSHLADEAIILCNHGCEENNCDICNPDDEAGSFLPVVRESVKPEDFVSAKRCELCDKFFPEDDMTQIQDWDDQWLFCKDCLEEMSEIVSETDMIKPVNRRIHEEVLEDVSSVNYVMNSDGEIYPIALPPGGTL